MRNVSRIVRRVADPITGMTMVILSETVAQNDINKSNNNNYKKNKQMDFLFMINLILNLSIHIYFLQQYLSLQKVKKKTKTEHKFFQKLIIPRIKSSSFIYTNNNSLCSPISRRNSIGIVAREQKKNVLNSISYSIEA